MQVATNALAYKAMLQEPKYIIDCFTESMTSVHLLLSDKDSVMSTNKKGLTNAANLLNDFLSERAGTS